MDGFPLMLRINGATCVVVGGGRAAVRKVDSLLDAGARVKVISPDIDPAIRKLRDEGKVEVIGRAYEGAGDLRGAMLVFAATDREEVNDMVYRDAVILGILVCDTGNPGRSSFHLPAVLRRGPLVMAVSTSGASPALAKRIRDELSDRYGPEYGDLLSFLAGLRRMAKETIADPAARQSVLKALAEADWIGPVRSGNWEDIRASLLDRLSKAEGNPSEWLETIRVFAARTPSDESGLA